MTFRSNSRCTRDGHADLRRRNPHLPNQASAAGVGRLPAQGARFPTRRLSHDRHRHRASGRLFAGRRRSRPHHDRRSDPRKRSRPLMDLERIARHRRALRDHAHQGARSGRPAPDHARDAALGAERQPLWHDAGRRHGMEPCRREQTAGPDRQHAGRPARRRWTADRPGIPHRTLGDRAAGQGSGRDAARGGCGAVRRVMQRPVRRADAGHRRDVRQPAVSQRRCDHDAASDSIAASPRRRHRHRDVRQRAARHDAGAGRLPSPARHRRPRRRHAAGDRRRGRRQGPDDWCALRARSHRDRRRGGDGLPGVRHTRRRLSVPGNGGDGSGDRRGTRDDAAAQRALPVRRADLARHGAPVGHRTGAGSSTSGFRSRRS